MAAYPDAKVVLTVRDSVSWYKSVKNSIFQGICITEDFAPTTFFKIFGGFEYFDVGKHVCYSPPKGLHHSMFSAIEAGQEASVEFFNQWVDQVKKTVPKERLLVYEVKQGWKPLCDFLGLPVPDHEFPRVNDTKEMLQTIANVKLISNLVVFGLPIALGLVLFLFLSFH